MSGWSGSVAARPALLALAACLAATPASARSTDHDALRTVEGTVGAVEVLASETGPEITAVRLRVDGSAPEEIEILLAPPSALSQSGFEVGAGDRLRARIFLSEDATVEAHKVLNLSRGMMLRLRTLRRVPLWDGNGQWQGGPCRMQDTGGPGGHRHRGGGGGR